jgi:phosphoglycolate phosphatase-like HAD superfamily hydrolase
VRIAVDIDSTLHHSWGQLEEVARRRFGVALPYAAQHTWSIDALTPAQLAECVAETHEPELVAAARPYAGAVDVIAGWRRAGHTIHVASHRAPAAHDHTAEWLHEIALPFDELRCDYGKVGWAASAGIGLLVDDSPVNLLQARAAGIVPATLVHPWNLELCEREGIACAGDWPALGDALASLLGEWRPDGGADDHAGGR